MSDYFSFELSKDFVSQYNNLTPPFGYVDAGGNSIGHLTFLRTYSRNKENGVKETWQDVCERVINGMYSIQKNWAKQNKLPWNDNKAQASAKEAFDRMFHLKWTPPGRGLWLMGTPVVMERGLGAGLQNCAFVSTYDMDRHDPGKPFAWTMSAMMVGAGVGYDTRGSERNFTVYAPQESVWIFEIPDTREGWADSVRLLINSYLVQNRRAVEFDYSLIRQAGEPIRGFGGVASGPESLRLCHENLRRVLRERVGQFVDSRLIVDLMNLIGIAVVSGNVRRGAQIALGDSDDKDFINLKNVTVFPERNSYDPDSPGWSYMSNNSVLASVGDDYSQFVKLIESNGEPGFVWLDVARNFGRLGDVPDGRDFRAQGVNPCSEQILESFEMCTLCEVHINNNTSKEDFLRTLKFAYLYGKTVTLLSTEWPETNAVMQRNRRIGLSLTGLTQFSDNNGLPELREWMESGYKVVSDYDKSYSEWLCIRESIRTTSVKPSGTVSILSGHSPGVHWAPGGQFFLRAIRFAEHDKMLPLFRNAGYTVEKDLVSANTYVVYFPIASRDRRSEKEVSIFEKINMAAFAQRHWADNAVSVTVSFDSDTEANLIPNVLHMYDGQLKAVSFLPMGNQIYPQQPYTQITKEEYDSYAGRLGLVDLSEIYGLEHDDAVGERYCSNDTCAI